MSDDPRPGDYRVICDFSGFKGWASETVTTWNGMRVLRRFVGSEQQRHPQDFVKAVPDRQTVPNPRPRGTDTFVPAGSVTPSDL